MSYRFNQKSAFQEMGKNPTESNKLKDSQARILATKVRRNEKVYSTKKFRMVEIQRCSRPLMNFAKETPETRVFLDADVFIEFFASIGVKLRNPEFDYKQAVGYVDRIKKSTQSGLKEIE